MNDQDAIKLAEIFRMVLELEDNEDVKGIRQINYKKWDSLAQVSLITAIESEFQITIDASDYERFTSYSAVKLLLEELQ